MRHATLAALCCSLFVLGCGEDGIKLEGRADKGPFIAGGSLEVRPADSPDATPKSAELDELGSFSLRVGRRGLVELVVTGQYFDEIAGEIASQPARLRAVADIGDVENVTRNVNVNVVTHITAPRIQALMAGESLVYSEAASQAEDELWASFGIDNPGPATGLGLVGDEPGGAELLTVSVIVMQAAYGQSSAASEDPLAGLLDSLASDLEDGSFEDATLDALVAAESAVNTRVVQDNINSFFQQQEAGSAPDLGTVLDGDGDGVVDGSDNCPEVANADQNDSNDDGVGDACLVAPFRQVLGASSQKLDVLFVIDDSGTMAEEQRLLTQTFPTFITSLRQPDGVLPDLHVGVISTNVGGNADNPCAGDGDAGNLINAPRVAIDCQGPSDRWIADVSDGTGGRATNYDGAQTLEETFACIAELGINGCGFEQPLESLRLALANPDNLGFLRDDALLAVVIVTDEDDCSVDPVEGAGFYVNEACDDYLDPASCPLGSLSSFRCFEFGVRCAPDQPRSFGTRSLASCASRPNSPYMPVASGYAEVLTSLKGDPSRVLVSVFAAPNEPVTVQETVTIVVGEPAPVPTAALAPSCATAEAQGYPAIRLAEFAGQFGSPLSGSICEGFGAGLTALAGGLKASLTGQCLITAPVDNSCVVTDSTGIGTESETAVQTLPD
ncbi:MAG: thrombospondin type 3 repeat-containing protein, partial [Deltaproteobacteria bacterium]|nr:thrombospondin type 3 repeat-containing protein [Deltaproteobacteria bacterium]